MSVFANASQSTNTIMRGNFVSFSKAAKMLLFDDEVARGVGARDFALTSGLIIDNVLKDATLYQGNRMGELLLKYNGFTGTEKLNRMLAAMTGAVYLKEQYVEAVAGSRRAVKRLGELGFSLDALRSRNGPDFDDMLVAGRKFVDETQFVDTPTERIRFAQNARMRWLLQFKTFTINQTRFMMRELQRRPVRTVMFGFGVMPAVGAGVNFARNTVQQQLLGAPPSRYQEHQTPRQEYLEAMANAGAWGLASDLMFSWAMQAELGELSRSVVTPPLISTTYDALNATQGARFYDSLVV